MRQHDSRPPDPQKIIRFFFVNKLILMTSKGYLIKQLQWLRYCKYKKGSSRASRHVDLNYSDIYCYF